jgi:hypothetical protein
VLEEQ